MIYVAQCLKDVYIKSMRLELKSGQTFDCSKAKYDSNPELKQLVSNGYLNLKMKNGAQTRLGVHSNNRFQVLREPKVVKEVVEKPVVIEKVIEKEVIVEKQAPQIDMGELANVLIQQLGNMISPEAIAEAVAKQIPTNVQNTQTHSSMINNTKSEELTFIPSKIISDTTKASESLANETKSEGSEELSDALSALKALRKANKK